MEPDMMMARQPLAYPIANRINLSPCCAVTGWLSSTNSVCVPAESSITVMHCRVCAATSRKSC